MQKKSQNKIELLAPAGDMEKLKTALHFGADAVYFAGKNYGLRAYGTNFDEFSEKAHRSYVGASNTQIKNAELLKNVMIKHGFKPIYTEWWHFDDSNYLNYPVINISLNEYVQTINDKMKGGEINEN